MNCDSTLYMIAVSLEMSDEPIFVIILPPKSLGPHALGEICSMVTKIGRNRKLC